MWEETVDRYIGFFDKRISSSMIGNDDLDWRAIKDDIKKAILNLEVMPSMRALMTAGPALERDHVAEYNCAYRAMKRPNRFAEIMYIFYTN